MLVFADTLMPLEDLPSFVRWLVNVNPLYYVLRCFFVLEFTGATYTRRLDDDVEGACDAYADYLNGTRTVYDILGLNASNVSNCSAAVNEAVELNNISNYNASDFDEPETTQWGGNLTTTLSDEEEKVQLLCTTEITDDLIFDALGIDPRDFWYWVGAVVVICVAMRVLSIVLLVVIGKDGFSWLKTRLKKWMCCCCTRRKRSRASGLASVMSATEETPHSIAPTSPSF